jgi:hypothetical protein
MIDQEDIAGRLRHTAEKDEDKRSLPGCKMTTFVSCLRTVTQGGESLCEIAILPVMAGRHIFTRSDLPFTCHFSPVMTFK